MKKILFLCLISFLIRAQSKAPFETVRTQKGTISGVYSNGVNVFKGIPFAAPPVGELRWKAPQPVANWQGVRKCDAFSASAMQPTPAPFMMYTTEFLAPPEPLSEDCLYLNVWTAAKAANEKRPVIVWIHGGGFSGGSGSVPLYDGEDLAKKGVVFVTINYRLGVFGFLAHPDLTRETNGKGVGNFAFLDQIAAFEWVKNNIAAFGGDPGNVTLSGQSAGAFSVNVLMASPLAKGLFHRAIAESGGMFGISSRVKSVTDAEQTGIAFTQKLQANSIADLRAKSAEEILKAGGGITSPVMDNYVITGDMYSLFANNKQNDVPLLTGWNAGDRFPSPKTLTAVEFKADVEKKYGAFANDFLKVYPANTDVEAKESQLEVGGHLLFAWQNYTWAKLQSSHGKNKAYLYFFKRVPPHYPDKPDFGAFHSAEFGYALHTLRNWDRPFTDIDRRLEDQMSSYWVNFARTGNPNSKGLPEWTAFEPGKQQVMIFDDKPETQSLPFKPQFEFWDKYRVSHQ